MEQNTNGFYQPTPQTTAVITIGEYMVRTKFNPSQNDTVDQIKQKTAELINLCETLRAKDFRLTDLAQTAYEQAAMWAVKAATQNNEL